MSSVVDAVIEKSGLSAIFARAAIERAVRRAGVNPEDMTYRDLTKCLPEIERSLAAYLGDRAPDALTAIRALTHR